MPSAARLRPWRGDDAEDIAVMTADPHIRRWSSMGDDPVAWVQRQRSGARCPSRAICLSEDDRALGKIALRLPAHASPATTCEAVPASDRPAGELSYWLVPAARGRGLAGAAVTAMLATEVPGSAMRSVILDIEETNVPSIRLAERLGAQRREPSRVEIDRTGEPRRMVVYVLPNTLPTSWR